MIDEPGPWGTGPFTLAEGHSRIDTEQATVRRDPLAATWLWREDRTPRVRLVANTGYWDKTRGPRLNEVVFRNDLSQEHALDLVCTTEGEVDVVTEVPPAQAERVQRSEHAKLVAVDAVRTIAGVINRNGPDLPLRDRRARRALNLAVDRDALVDEAMFGRARPLAGLTPPTALTAAQRFPGRIRPYPHDAQRAAELWRAAGGGRNRPMRIAAWEKLERLARMVAAQLQSVLGVDPEVTLFNRDQELQARRALAEKAGTQDWDVLILEQACQTGDAPTLELHRAMVGATGEYRAGPVIPEFEALWRQLVRRTSQLQQAQVNNRIDRFVTDEALALFLVAPDALYAVNRRVHFKPYRTSFELAECHVNRRHWSRR